MDIRICITALLFVVRTSASYPGLCIPDEKNACRDYSSAEKCTLTEYCKINVWSHTVASESKLCQTCKTDIANLQKFITAKTTKEFVKYDLLALCRACPFASGRNECRTLIDENFDKIYDDVVLKLDPNVICRGLHICKNSDLHEGATNLVKEILKDRLGVGSLWLPGPVRIQDDVCFTAQKCSDYSTAVKCGVLDTCKKYIWTAPLKTTTVCDKCKAEIKKIHDLIADNKTEDEIKKELLMFCDSIPFQRIQQKCHNLIATDFDIVYQDIVAYLDADIICSALGLCAPSYELKSPASCELDASHACLDYASAAECNTLNYCQYVVWDTPVQENKLCQCCMNDVDKLRGFLDSNRTRERVEAGLQDVCKLLPWQSLKFKCQTTVLRNFERLYQNVINHLNSTVICRSLLLCWNQEQDDAISDAFLSVITNLQFEKDSTGCRFCKGQIKALQDWMKSSPTKQAVEKKLQDFCSDIKLTAFREECQSAVSEHFDEIYDLLIAETDPDVLCQQLKICAATSENQDTASANSCSSESRCSDYNTAKKCGVLAECKSTVWSKPIVEDDSICQFCEGQIKALQDFIKDNATEAEVRQGLTSFCNDLKLSAFKAECLSFVNDNFEDIYADLTALVDPTTVCTYLKLCNQITLEKLEKTPEDASASCSDELACEDYKSAVRCGKLEKCKATYWSAPVEDSNICELCKDEIAVLQNWLKSAPVSLVVKNAISNFCESIPLTAFRNECKDNVDNNFDDIYSDLTSLVQPTTICRGLKLCESVPNEKYVNAMMEKLPDLLKKAMKDHKLPVRAPFETTHNCEVTITGACYDITSARLCNSVEQCKQVWSRPVQHSEICDLCTGEIELLQKFINSTRDQVRTELSILCLKIPITALREECTDSVKNNLDSIYDLIVSMMDPSGVCTSLRLCTAAVDNTLETDAGSCKECESFIDDFQNSAFNNEEIMASLLELAKPKCDALDGNGALCDMMSYQMMMEHGREPANPATVCKATNMCNVKDVFDGGMCSTCKAFFKKLQEAVKSNPAIVDKLVYSASEFYCLRKSPTLRTKCVKYMKMVINVYIESMEIESVEKVCQRVQFCPATPNAQNWKEFARKAAKVVLEWMPKRSTQIEGEPCADCKSFVTDLQTAIKNSDPIVMQLVGLVESQCRTLGEFSGLCVDLIKSHYESVLKQFAALDVTAACDGIRMCPASQNAINGDICTDCKAFFGDVQYMIINNKSLVDADVADLKNAVCSEVPSIFAGECDKIFDEHAAPIVTALSTQTPEQTCNDIDFCDNDNEVKKAAAISENTNEKIPGVCAVCEAVMKYIDDHINYNTTEQEIDNLLLEVCSHLPEYSDQCDDFVKKYASVVVKLIIEEGTSPMLVCKALALCGAPPEKVVNGPAECDVCTFVFTEIQHILADKTTETEIVQELAKVCSVIGKYKTECEFIINEYGPTLLKVLANEVDPSAVCELIKLCPKTDVPQLPKSKENAHNGVMCEVCTQVADQLDRMLNNPSTEAEIRAALDMVCTLVPSQYQSTCEDLINANIQTIVNFLKTEMNPKVICVKVLHVCPALENAQTGVLCEVCTLVADQLDQMLSDKSTQAEIKHALETVCSYLPGDFNETCTNLIEDNFQAIMTMLVNEMNPKVICVQLKVCPAQDYAENGALCDVCTKVATQLDQMLSDKSTQAEIKAALDMVCKLVPSEYQSTCETMINSNIDAIVKFLVTEMNPKVICVKVLHVCPALENAKVGALCDVCTLVAEELDQKLSDTSTQAEIKHALETVCSYLPGDFNETCTNLIEDNFQKIMTMLVNEMNPKVICVQLGVCPSLVSAADSCQMCELAATVFDDILKNDYIQQEGEAALKEICSFFPDETKTTCEGVMDQAGKEVFKLLVSEFAPNMFCKDAGFCPKKLEKIDPDTECEVCELIAAQLETLASNNLTQEALEKAMQSVCYFVPKKHRDACVSIITNNYSGFMKIVLEELQPKVICGDLKMCPATKTPNDVSCEVCSLAMEYLDKTLADNATQAEIEKAVEELCNILPSSYKEECDTLVETDGRMIIDLLVQELKPSVICAKLGLCPAKEISVKKTLNSVTCEVCTLAMKYLDDTLADHATQTEIEKAVEELCNIVPSSYKAECDTLIETYGSLIIGLLVQELKPSVICAELKLCPAKEISVKKAPNDVTCELCTLAMKYLDDTLADNATEAEIEKAVEELCNLVPSSYKTECDTLIETYGDLIIKLLVQELKPSQICAELGLCSAAVIPVKKPLKYPGECVVCKFVMDGLRKLLSEESVEKDILAAVDSVCNIIPQEYKGDCQLYINNYGPGVISILVEDFVPDEVCEKLHQCSGSLQTKRTLVMKMHVGDEECSICKAIITALDDFLEKNYTQAAVEHALEEICDYVPASIKSECDSIVMQYAPMIFKYIEEIGDPAFLCQHLGLCPTDLKQSQLLGGNKCTYGPSYWCQNMDTATACHAVQHCKNHVW